MLQLNPSDPAFSIGGETLRADDGIMRTGKVNVDAYTSTKRFELEREVFGRVWLNVGRVDEIPQAGDWVVKDVDVRSVSAIIVRGKDQTIRAFHNICSHRSMKLVWGHSGKGGKFSCPYHAWTYNSEGKLTHIPDEACFSHVDKAESGLSPINCDVWEGFIFINLDPNPAQTLLEFLGPVAARLKDAPFSDYPFTFTISQVVEANWKLGLEAASEGYHVQAMHKATAREMVCSTENPHVHFLTFEMMGPHRTASIPRNTGYQAVDGRLVQNFAFASAPQMVIDSTQGADLGGFFAHPAINPLGANDWGNDQFTLFPNASFNVAVNGWWITKYWPLTPSKALWSSKYYFKSPVNWRGRFALHYSQALQRDIMSEDNLCIQKQQAVMEAGIKKVIQFGEEEKLCRHLAAVWEAISDASEMQKPAAMAAE